MVFAKDADARRVGGDVEGWHAPQPCSSLAIGESEVGVIQQDMLIRMTTSRQRQMTDDRRPKDPENVWLWCTDVVMAGGIS